MSTSPSTRSNPGRHRWRHTLLRPLLPLAWLLAAAQPARAELPPPVQRLLADAGLPEDAIGLVVAPAAGGPRAVAHGADRLLQTGSAMKLVTTLVALEQLGPGWRGQTRLLATGPVRDGVLLGDLVLQGRADMDLSWQALQDLLRHARDRGLREVRGALVLDRSAFDPPRLDQGLPPFDESPEAPYNVIPDALLVNGNLMRVDVFVDEQRGLQVVPQVPLTGVRVTHEMQLVDGDCRAWDEGWQAPEVRAPKLGRQMDIVLRGTWPARCDRAVEFNVLDRNEFVGRVSRALLQGLGIRLRGAVRDGVAPADARVLAERSSRPLSELVRAINKPSDNALSRTLYLALGRATAALPGAERETTSARAERAVRQWMRSKGIDDTGAVFENGSGLSRRERLSPAQFEAVIRAGLASRWAPEFIASLPIGGVDGTLRNRMTAQAATGTARMKTGTLRNVVALAGTVPDAAGQSMIMVALINHDSLRARTVRPVLDALTDWVARTRFAPDAAGASAASR